MHSQKYVQIDTNNLQLSRTPSLSVPSTAPSNVTAVTTSPTSVSVTWNQIPSVLRNGVIVAYEVMYTWLLDNGQLSTNYTNTSGDVTYLFLDMLQECVQYNISVRAYTSQGPGPFSTAVLDSSLNGIAL